MSPLLLFLPCTFFLQEYLKCTKIEDTLKEELQSGDGPHPKEMSPAVSLTSVSQNMSWVLDEMLDGFWMVTAKPQVWPSCKSYFFYLPIVSLPSYCKLGMKAELVNSRCSLAVS